MKGVAGIVLPCLPTLRHLHFDLVIFFGDDDPYLGLGAELEAIAGQNAIESITIVLNLIGPKGIEDAPVVK